MTSNPIEQPKHLWYSQKFETEMHNQDGYKPNFYQKSDGSIVQVSFVTTDAHHDSHWDDVVYLGIGTWQRIGW